MVGNKKTLRRRCSRHAILARLSLVRWQHQAVCRLYLRWKVCSLGISTPKAKLPEGEDDVNKMHLLHTNKYEPCKTYHIMNAVELSIFLYNPIQIYSLIICNILIIFRYFNVQFSLLILNMYLYTSNTQAYALPMPLLNVLYTREHSTIKYLFLHWKRLFLVIFSHNNEMTNHWIQWGRTHTMRFPFGEIFWFYLHQGRIFKTTASE